MERSACKIAVMSVDEEEGGKDLNVGDPNEVGLEKATGILKEGVSLMRSGDHGSAVRRFEEVYKSDTLPKPISGLSYYGYCIAKTRKSYREAIELCERAVKERPDDPAHWANLTEVLMMANRRVKAIYTIDEAIKRFPRTKLLQDLRVWVGRRRPPVIPFLDRSNPINVILGHMRHTWIESRESKKNRSAPPPKGKR